MFYCIILAIGHFLNGIGMFAKVVVDVSNNNIDKLFDYHINDAHNIVVGMRVLVPFGGRKVEGYVMQLTDTCDLDKKLVKDIIEPTSSEPLITEESLSLIYFLKQINHLRLIDAIHLVVPATVRKNTKELTDILIELNKNSSFAPNKNAKNQINLIEYLKNKDFETKSNLCKMFGNSTVNTLINKNALTTKTVKKNRLKHSSVTSKKENTLTINQQKVVDSVINEPNFYLLHGVTGSGKTEVYKNIIKHFLSINKTAILLVPEISLTPQMVQNFTSWFGELVAVLHSGLNDGEKFDEWQRILKGEAKIVIGARSAIFAPLKNLGVIIIDEEHDGSYISDSNPRYSAVEVAKFRCRYNKCSLLLGSATPNIESYYLAQIGEYKLLELPTRINNNPMPSIEIVDMAKEFRNGNTSPFSPLLLAGLQTAISNNEQSLIFINRRGYSSFLMCRDCGYVPKCTDCDVSLAYHKEDDLLKCHYCGKKFKVLTGCPECGSKNIKLGGVGTERVVFELQKIFPDVKIFRMDLDTTSTKNAHEKILKEFEQTKPAILVGTQMISKGHDFPAITFVGILDADLSLYFSDYKATEKTFALVTQVAGRAGRAEKKGNVVLQTYFPKHYVYNFACAYDYKNFYKKEINLRETTKFPPFSTLVRILITSTNDDIALSITHDLFLKLKELKMQNKESIVFLEAMRAPVTKVKGKHRYQIVMRVLDKNLLDNIYLNVESMYNNNVQIFVEINPNNFSWLILRRNYGIKKYNLFWQWIT